MTYARHFWYDGHHGEIESTGRERYTSYLNGEQFEDGSNPYHMKQNMLDEIKYRVERDPDYYVVCHGVLWFLDSHVPGRNGENEWVLMDSIREEVIMNDWGLCLEVMHGLNDADLIEVTKAYDSPNYQYCIRPTIEGGYIPVPKELSEQVTKLWVGNE
jgi:hypothetical protein